MFESTQMRYLACGLVTVLTAVSVAGFIVGRIFKTETHRRLLAMLNSRIRVWWGMTAVLAVAAATGGIGSIVVFGLTSFLLLREFVTMTPTRRSDHRALFWVFLTVPLQYLLLGMRWYGLFTILVPVYAFLLIPARMAVAGDPCRFLERAAKIQWGVMLCVYCISHAPALVRLKFPGDPSTGIILLLFLGVVTQVSDTARQIVDFYIGKNKVVPNVCDHLTNEGFISAICCGILAGLLMSSATPFSPLQGMLIAFLSSLLAYAGHICFRAIRKDQGARSGVTLETRPSVLERVIGLCFAAPVFFHLTRFFFTPGDPVLF